MSHYSCKKLKAASTKENVSSPLLGVQSYRSKFDEKKKNHIQQLITSVNEEVVSKFEQIGKKLNISNSIMDNVLKMQLAAPDCKFSGFSQLAKENDFLVQAYADLKTVIASEEIDNHLRANRDPLSFKAEDMSPLTYYMRTVMRKHKLIMTIKEKKIAADAKSELLKMWEGQDVRELISESSIREINRCSFDTEVEENDLKLIQKLIDNASF